MIYFYNNGKKNTPKKEFFMKKRILSAIFIFIFTICTAMFASAESKEEYTSQNGLYVYRLDENQNAEILSYNGSETYIILSKIDGKYDVSKICEGAFKGNEKLKKITLPKSVKEIADSAFFGCTSLTEVAFSEEAGV